MGGEPERTHRRDEAAVRARRRRNKATTDNGSTPLHMASWKGHTDVVTLLLQHGADADKAIDRPMVRTPLWHGEHVRTYRRGDAAAPARRRRRQGGGRWCHTDVRGELEGAHRRGDAAAPARRRRTQGEDHRWYHAADHGEREGHVGVVTLLLQHDADADRATTVGGCTPLWVASLNGHTDVVKLLLAHGADADKARTTDGATPLIMRA